jgi:hypothetical protein
MNRNKSSSGFDRRQILKLAGYGTLGLISGEFWPFFDLSVAGQNGAVTQKTEFLPDLDISLIARPTEPNLYIFYQQNLCNDFPIEIKE